MSKIKVQWTASSELVRKEYITTGEQVKAERVVELDMTALTPEQRKPIIEAKDCLWELNVSEVFTFKADRYLYNANYLDRQTKALDNAPTVTEVVAYCERFLAEHRKAQAYKAEVKAAEKAEKERVVALAAEWQPRLAALIAAKDLNGLNAFHAPPELTAINYQANKAWRELKRERQEADKEIWIKYHAAAHLKRAFEAGYDCQREYVLQRATQEAPDDCASLQVDFNTTANWQSRCCPSSKALDIAAVMEKRFSNAKVVWLTEPPSSDILDPDRDYYEDYGEPFEPCEAVVSQGYLDKYNLIQIV